MESRPPSHVIEAARAAFAGHGESRAEAEALREALKAMRAAWGRLGPDGQHHINQMLNWGVRDEHGDFHAGWRAGLDFGDALDRDIVFLGECFVPKGATRLLPLREPARILLKWRNKPLTNTLYDRHGDGEQPCKTIQFLQRELSEVAQRTITHREVHSVLRNMDAE
ncbi:MAG: hypothetical protein KDA43_14770 [Hyphomonas sp.]|nr:hypothetical protein [Hyphomonas sp.]